MGLPGAERCAGHECLSEREVGVSGKPPGDLYCDPSAGNTNA